MGKQRQNFARVKLVKWKHSIPASSSSLHGKRENLINICWKLGWKDQNAKVLIFCSGGEKRIHTRKHSHSGQFASGERKKSCCQPDLEKILYSWMFRFVFVFHSQILWAKKYFSLVSVLLRMSKSWKHWARLSLKLSFRLNRAVAGIEFCATFKAFQLNVRKLACLLAAINY